MNTVKETERGGEKKTIQRRKKVMRGNEHRTYNEHEFVA